jgi:DNA repair protein RadC
MNNQPATARKFHVREKLLTTGAESLSDTELLAALIGSGSGNKSCMQLATDLLNHFGDLRAILNACPKNFQEIHGLGVVRYVQLQAVREICRRSDFIQLKKRSTLNNSQQAWIYLKRQLRDKKNETIAGLFLDSQYRIIAYDELFTGTINAATLHPRPIIERSLRLNAAALIIAHNHPSGMAEASLQDCKVTDRLRNALELVDVKLVDHIIVGDNEIYSLMNTAKWICH